MFKLSKEKFAEMVGKKHTLLTFSGEMAFEIALEKLGARNKKVLFQNNVCHKILLAVLRVGAIPVIVNPQNGLFLTKEDVETVCEKHKDIAVFLAVHQYGIKIDIKSIKKALGKNVKIIEDIAQSWGVDEIGKYSDHVITSFGMSKQMSHGFAGAVFSDDATIEDYVDISCKRSRANDNLVIPYVLPENIKLNFKKLNKKANKTISKQIESVKKHIKMLDENFPEIQKLDIDRGVWNRYPVWTEDENVYLKFLDFLQKSDIKFEKPFKNKLEKVNFLQNREFFYEDLQGENKRYFVLLKTR